MSANASATASTGSATAQPGQPEPRQIILLSDGTGNSAAAVWRTNVWRVFESLDLTESSRIALYDDGVGSSSFKPLAILGGAFGYGLKRNVIHLYSFLCRNYREPPAGASEPAPQIYMFGFSRGAFTIRVLIGLIDSQGLVPYHSEAQLYRDAKAAYRAYRRERYTKNVFVNQLRNLRDIVIEGLKAPHHRYDRTELATKPKPKIHFVGLWDTVAAYGLPIDEMTRGVDLMIWPLELPNRRFAAERIAWARHALSLDDERTTFHPVLWSESDIAPVAARADGYRYVQDERLSQVWFSGVHSNVGGGYPDDSLACVPLYWMLREAQLKGLKLKIDPPVQPDSVKRALWASDRDGRLYDSRSGLGGYYRYGPRKMADLCNARNSNDPKDEVTIAEPKIHFSVFERMKNGAHAYAPFVLPETYAVVDDDGRILDGPKRAAHGLYESPTLATARAGRDPKTLLNLRQYWRAIRCPRCLAFYVAFLALIVLLTSTLAHISLNADGMLALNGDAWLDGIVSVFGSPWSAFSEHPRRFGGALAIFAVSLAVGYFLAARPRNFLPAPPAGAQEDIWNLVWHRRVAYFATLAFSAYLALFPFIHHTRTENTVLASPLSFISPIIRLVGGVLPSFASFWIDAFALNPGWFLIGVAGVAGMMVRGASVAARITDAMRTMWSEVLIAKKTPGAANPGSWVYRLRTDECYRSMLWALKRNILPVFFGILFIYLGCVAVIRPIFAVADSVGYVCTRPDDTSPRPAPNQPFPTNALCWDSGARLDANTRYTITLTLEPGQAAWKDGRIDTDFGGYGVERMKFWKYVTWPLRRSIAQPWFKPIARIGDKGGDEYPLDSARPVDKKDLERELVAEITTRTSGQLYLYVNDAIGIPFDVFYRRGYANQGTATVCVQKSPNPGDRIAETRQITVRVGEANAASEKPKPRNCL
jgi:uncharacterized protein (DUF2235 family)